MADIAGDVAVNPDAQAAVTDFLDYTEYLPADLIRSLILIRGLDETYLENSHAVHDLTKVYGTLPSLPPPNRPDAQHLRSRISTHLDRALDARESAFAEACRLFDLTDRHQDRLKSIIAKLQALPKPPSRDPTPPPPGSAQKRSRSGRKLENGTTTQRLTLKAPKGTIAAAILHRPKHRRVTVPGEVLPPYDPDEPIASTEVSDWDSDPPSPVRPVLKLKQLKPPKPAPLPDRIEKKPREPRETATYRKPTPPPDDAVNGSKYRPWTHLTEFEMYKLRKKMKKNHAWEPSEVMIRRELAEKGRGWDNYYKAKATAEAKGLPFIDIENSEKPQSTPNGKPETSAPANIPSVTPSAAVPKSQQPKKVETKKDKRENPIRDKASLAAQETEQAARKLGDIGSAFRNLFSPLQSGLAYLNRSSNTPNLNSSSSTGKKVTTEKSQPKKRKAEEVASASPSIEPEGQKKKPKLTHKESPLPTSDAANVHPPSAGTIKIPLKLNINTQENNASTASTPATTSRPMSANRTLSITLKSEGSPPPFPRPVSGRSTAASAEPSLAAPSTRASRRTSMTPAAQSSKVSGQELTPKTVATAASRRSKREAPGTVTQSSQDGGAAVSISTRKTKPNRHSKAQAAKAAADAVVPAAKTDKDGIQDAAEPDVDDERYCICGDVSYGEMICCELEEKCEFGEWFHMECVQLIEPPPRTVKWYCPGDRKKYHKGENSNGLVGRGIKA